MHFADTERHTGTNGRRAALIFMVVTHRSAAGLMVVALSQTLRPRPAHLEQPRIIVTLSTLDYRRSRCLCFLFACGNLHRPRALPGGRSILCWVFVCQKLIGYACDCWVLRVLSVDSIYTLHKVNDLLASGI